MSETNAPSTPEGAVSVRVPVHPKVVSATGAVGAAGAVVVILAFFGITVPLAVVLSAVTVLTFVAGYFR